MHILKLSCFFLINCWHFYWLFQSHDIIVLICAPNNTPQHLQYVCPSHTHILTMILMHIWHFEAPFVMRGRRGGAGDISCSHNVIHYGRGALERVQRALPACATTHLSPCPLLFSLAPSLFTLGEMAGAFFPSPGGLRDIPACFGLIRQTYITYLSLSPASLSSSNFALGESAL